MAEAVIEGLLLGLTLAVLVGPIFVALIQTGVQRGIRAGLWVGSGIWISDLLVILSCWVFMADIKYLSDDSSLRWWMGLAGGLVLITTGIVALFKKYGHDLDTAGVRAAHSIGFFFKGFGVNFINPFTFVFWSGVTAHYAGVRNWSAMKLFLLFSVILGVIVATDSLKVVLSGWIRRHLTLVHLTIFGRVSGTLLIIFGVVLMLRSGVIVMDLR